MTRKTCALAVALAATVVLFSACIIEYNFDTAPPWTNTGGSTFTNRGTGTARGWGGTITVTVMVQDGRITEAVIDAPRETPSHTRVLLQSAPRMIVITNSFDFLDGMSGATVTRDAIREAGESALVDAGAFL